MIFDTTTALGSLSISTEHNDVQAHAPPEPNPLTGRIGYVVKHAMDAFTRATNATITTRPRRDPTGFIERWLREECVKRSIISIAGIEDAIDGSVNISSMAYAHSNIETQLYVSAYTFISILLDNSGVDRSILEVYILRGEICDNHILEWFTQLLAETHRHFTPYATAAIKAGSMRYIQSLVLDFLITGQPVVRGALQFADYHRSLSGIAECYALFVFDKCNFAEVSAYVQAIPEIMLYINHVNDILSFYKEELDGENAIYIYERAHAVDKDVEEVLEDVVGEVVAAITLIERTLQGPEREAWTSFMVGYIYFHVCSDRYRLRELGLTM